MKFIESLASYVPGLIVDRLITDCDNRVTKTSIPWRQKYETVCLFCDVSGFTALSEKMALNGKGAEGLAKHLNSYFSQMVRLIAMDGGDVFKFAGDAMIVLWPAESQDDMETTVRRAAQCAYAIQENLDKSIMEEGVQLSVKIGIGFGQVSVLHIGGVFGRVEYLAVGEPLIQAFQAEHKAVSGQVICSKEVWAIISEYFKADCIFPDGYCRLNMDNKNNIKFVRKTAKVNMLRTSMDDTDAVLENRIKTYVPGAVLPNLNRDSPEDEQWGNDKRQCVVMFVNLGLKEQHLLAAAVYDEAMVQVHEVLVETQRAVYQYEGSINKFLMDDKGSTLIACFGLPPLSHEDDPIRAVLASLKLCESLYKLGLIASIGITTGDVFCGVVGGKTRREYTVLGDSVNLSARLMQKACMDGGGILCDFETKSYCSALDFMALDDIKVKGKTAPIKVFRPYTAELGSLVTGFKGSNPYTAIHNQQLQNAIVYRSLLAVQSYFAPPVQRPTNRISTSSHHSTISSKAGTRRSSAASLGAVLEEINRMGPKTSTGKGPPQTSLVSQVRQGNHVVRTRKSVVMNISSIPSPSMSGLSESERGLGERRTSMSFKLPLHKDALAPITPLRSYQSSRSLVEKTSFSDHYDIDIFIAIPHNMKLDSYDEHNEKLVCSLRCTDVRDFADLLKSAYEKAIAQDQIPDDVVTLDGATLDSVILNVTGTRFFLPNAPIDIKWLSSFVFEAKCGYNDDWKFGQPLHLSLVRSTEKQKVQSRLALAHRVLLEHKVALLDSMYGSVVLLEGDAGIGKSALLTSFISKTLPNSCEIYFSPASPYSTAAFGPFAVVVQQFLDHDATRRGITRTDVLLEILSQNEHYEQYGVLLDEILQTNAHEEILRRYDDEDIAIELNDVLELSAGDKTARRLALMYYFLHFISQRGPCIIIIDDAHYLDDESWALSLMLSLSMSRSKNVQAILGDSVLPELSHIPPSIMLILSFRPLVTNRAVFRGVSQPYEALAGDEGVVFLKLDGLPPEEEEELILSKLGDNVISISEQLYKLIESKCNANPASIIHLVTTLQYAQPPVLVYTDISEMLDDNMSMSSTLGATKSFSNRKGSLYATPENKHMLTALQEVHVSMVDDFQFEKCPLPYYTAVTYGVKLDRLNSCQQMILKTAAHIGHSFKLSFLQMCYPLEGHKYRLSKELSGLLNMGYIVEIPKSKAMVENDQVFHFISSFLVDLICGRMLKEHRDVVMLKVNKAKDHEQSLQRKLFMQKALQPGANNSNGEIKFGILEIQKKVTDSFIKVNFKRKLQGGDWKQRFCVIRGNNLSMYRDRNHYTVSPTTPTQIIFFDNANAEVEPNGVHQGKDFVFRLDANSYKKDGVYYNERRSFLFCGINHDDVTDWVYMIKYAIELNNTQVKQQAEQEVTQENPKDLSQHDAYVTLTVIGTRNMSSTEVYGSTNCYILATLDKEEQRTSVSFESTRNHLWRHTFTIPVTKKQWITGSIKLTVCTKELFLTDDILGQVSLPIIDMTPTESEEAWLAVSGKCGLYEQLKDMCREKTGEIGVSCYITFGEELRDMISSMPMAEVKERVRDDLETIEAIKLRESIIQGVPGRLVTINDLKMYLDMNSLLLAPKRLSMRERKSSIKKVRMTERTIDSFQLKNLQKKLADLLQLVTINDEATHSTAESGSVNRMWILSELRQLCGNKAAAPEPMNPFAHILEQANELDQQHMDWLSSQYTRNSTASVSTPPASSRRSSVRFDDALSRTSTTSVTFKTSKEEPPVLDTSFSIHEGYYIKDNVGTVLGPFSMHEVYQWYVQDKVNFMTLIHHGASGSGSFYPFSMFHATFSRVLNEQIVQWPDFTTGIITSSIRFDKDHVMKNFTSWDFDVWDLNASELLPLSMAVISSVGLHEIFNIEISCWVEFMHQVEHYMTHNSNPYHNYYHICDVMLTCYLFLTSMEAIGFFQDTEILALLVGALVHDLDHTGTNNLYHINAKTKLALLYNDTSVLENHHCATAFNVILEPKSNIFSGLSETQFRSVRKLMISIILATDMTFHFSLKEDLEKLIAKKFAPSTEAPLAVVLDDKERETLLKIILHTADISNPTKIWKISKKWSDLVITEFFEQGDREKRESLPISPNMDRVTTQQDELSINFIDFIVAPYFMSLTNILPKVSSVCVRMNANRNMWHDQVIARLQPENNEEAIGKWEKRKSVFDNIMKPIEEKSVQFSEK